MSSRSPFDFDISVSADKKRRARSRSRSGAVESSSRTCSHPNCDKPGKYRAPKSPDQLDEFLWFCLEHVREYNLKWNFFHSHSDEELEQQFNADRVWERQTRPFAEGRGQDRDQPHSEGRAWQRLGIDDPMDILGEKGTQDPRRESARSLSQRRLPPTERRALEILESRDTQTKSEIRRQYKALVKDLHPDMNGGRRDDEARLAEVVWAWEQIKASRSFKD
ncbi:MAG: J domain-containing protein [Pseudomonadota bacterium]